MSERPKTMAESWQELGDALQDMWRTSRVFTIALAVLIVLALVNGARAIVWVAS